MCLVVAWNINPFFYFSLDLPRLVRRQRAGFDAMVEAVRDDVRPKCPHLREMDTVITDCFGNHFDDRHYPAARRRLNRLLIGGVTSAREHRNAARYWSEYNDHERADWAITCCLNNCEFERRLC